MGRISTSITINAPVEEVKKIFFDFPKHKEWNPFFKSIEVTSADKEVKVGNAMKILMELPDSKSTFTPVITEVSDHVFKWHGKLLFDFIAGGTHVFEFNPETVDGKEVTKFVQYEDFSGFLFAMMTGMLKQTEIRFGEMNEALKALAEKK